MGGGGGRGEGCGEGGGGKGEGGKGKGGEGGEGEDEGGGLGCGGLGTGGNGGGVGGGGLAVAVRRLPITKEAVLRSHLVHPGPSSQLRSSLLHKDATRASLPIAALVACSADGGTPPPIGLPAIFRSKELKRTLPWLSVIVRAPSASVSASTSKGLMESTILPGP